MLNRFRILIGFIVFSIFGVGHAQVDKRSRTLDQSGFNLNLDSGLAFNTNPYSLPLRDIESFGSFVFRMRPSLEFQGLGRVARIFIGAKADVAALFGASQSSRFMLSAGEFIGKSELNSDGLISMLIDGTIETSRQVEDLFLDSLTQVKADFRFGTRIRPGNGPITVHIDGEAKNQSYFDIDQPVNGKFSGEPKQLSNESYYGQVKLLWAFADQKELNASGKYGLWRGQQESKTVSMNPLRIDVGVAGDIAPSIRARLSVGYANTYIRLLRTNTLLDGASASFSVCGEVGWLIAKDSNLSIKILRELSPTSIFLEVYRNSIEVKYNKELMRKVGITVAPFFTFYEYGKPLAPDNAGRLAGNHRSDIILGMREELAYAFEDWLYVGLSHEGKFRWSNARDLQVFTPGGKVADPSGSFSSFTNQHEVFLFTRLMY